MAAVYLDEAILALRLALGILFVIHGWPKCKDFAGTKKFIGSIGFKPVALWAFLLTFTELAGGILLILGFATRIMAALLIIAMLVALYHNKFVWKKPFKDGWELDFILIIALIVILAFGAGVYSLEFSLGMFTGFFY